jgi:hypothetical protein
MTRSKSTTLYSRADAFAVRRKRNYEAEDVTKGHDSMSLILDGRRIYMPEGDVRGRCVRNIRALANDFKKHVVCVILGAAPRAGFSSGVLGGGISNR